MATLALLNTPNGIAVDPESNVYFADTANYRMRRVDPNGLVTTIGGNGQCCAYTGEAPATQVSIYPWMTAADGGGNVFVASGLGSGSCTIEKISPEGVISRFAGSGSCGDTGDGGPATAAKIMTLGGMAVGPDGSVYIADEEYHRIRRVDAQGIINTVAGTGKNGFSGDGGPATAADLSNPSGVAIAPDGTFYIADTNNCRVRMVSMDGTITTIAGTEKTENTGDGGPAAEASLSYPFEVALDQSGRLFLLVRTGTGGGLIRRIDPDGKIHAALGTGYSAITGDNSSISTLSFSDQSFIAVDELDQLYISDPQYHRVVVAIP